MKISIVVLCGILALVNAEQNGVATWLPLNDGWKIPGLGLGTWLGLSSTGGRVIPTGSEVTAAVEWAIDAGYRHIDTAAIYRTEEQVGRGINNKIAEGVVTREQLFVTTKLWNDHHARSAVIPGLKNSLKLLNLTYVDLYLIHWPIATFPNGSIDNSIDYMEAWRGLIDAREQGLTRSIGVSNFNLEMLERLLSLSDVVPASLQVEINLNLQQPELLNYCKLKGIQVTGYTPFGSLFYNKATATSPPPRVDDKALVEIAARHNKTVPQVALRYLMHLGVTPIPKSLTKSRIEQNIDVFDFELTEEEKNVLKAYDVGYRSLAAKWFSDSIYYPFDKN